ncbi:MAG TPA: hypothetical protein VFI81_08255, partial [Rhodanobacteraceae bacterium]|nr:hypothetical protein [Rhodanobacteraceae bacterium]
MTNKSGDKTSALRRTRELASGPGALLFLFACLAFVASAFCAWQAWMTWSRISGAHQVEAVTQAELAALNKFVADTRQRVIREIDGDAVAAALASGDDAGRAAASTALKQALPDLVSADFYRPDLSDVLGTDFAKFGYAKAAMLVQAHQTQVGVPLQSRQNEHKQRVLAFAVPVVHDKQTLAYAYVELPFEPLLKVFREQRLSDARIDLRQGKGRGDVVLASIGSTMANDSLTDLGLGVGGSMFRIGGTAEDFSIFLPGGLWLAVPLALILFGLGLFVLQARDIGLREALDRFLRRRSTVPAEAEQTLAQTIVK